eukprot:1779646-Prymnesium_polylepis.1
MADVCGGRWRRRRRRRRRAGVAGAAAQLRAGGTGGLMRVTALGLSRATLTLYELELSGASPRPPAGGTEAPLAGPDTEAAAAATAAARSHTPHPVSNASAGRRGRLQACERARDGFSGLDARSA